MNEQVNREACVNLDRISASQCTFRTFKTRRIIHAIGDQQSARTPSSRGVTPLYVLTHNTCTVNLPKTIHFPIASKLCVILSDLRHKVKYIAHNVYSAFGYLHKLVNLQGKLPAFGWHDKSRKFSLTGALVYDFRNGPQHVGDSESCTSLFSCNYGCSQACQRHPHLT